MGTASTMNSLAEALGMSLPGSAAIPAPHRDRARNAYLTGRRIVEMVHEDLKPSDVLTREAFENAIVVNSAIGGSTNAPIHIGAIARHVGVDLPLGDWQRLGLHVPLLVDLQPAGKYLGEEYYRAGGVPAVVHELMAHGLIHEDARTVNGRTLGENCRDAVAQDRDVIRTFDTAPDRRRRLRRADRQPVRQRHHEDQRDLSEFRERYLSDPEHPNVFSGTGDRLRRPGGLPRPHRRPGARDRRRLPAVHPRRRPARLPGSAEVVNMQPPAALIKRGVLELPCIGDGRQSGTSGSPSILNASPRRRRRRARPAAHRRPVGIDLVAGTVDVCCRTRSWPSDGARWKRPAATRRPPRRRRGRRSSAEWSTSSATAWCCGPPSPTNESPEPAASRATATDPTDDSGGRHGRSTTAHRPGAPARDAYDLPSSDGRFSDGGQYRVEIPSVEGPEALAVVLEEAGRRGVPVHRISQGSGIMMQTDDEVREMLKLGEGSGVEVCLFTGPRASWDVGVQAGTPSGRVSAGSLRGADQLGYAVEDVLRGCELGLRSILVADLGALMVLGRLKRPGDCRRT
jgi:hypothetical protein